jgi:hypothetical protein
VLSHQAWPTLRTVAHQRCLLHPRGAPTHAIGSKPASFSDLLGTFSGLKPATACSCHDSDQQALLLVFGGTSRPGQAACMRPPGVVLLCPAVGFCRFACLPGLLNSTEGMMDTAVQRTSSAFCTG